MLFRVKNGRCLILCLYLPLQWGTSKFLAVSKNALEVEVRLTVANHMHELLHTYRFDLLDIL